jgi:hypothetical protein
LNHACDSKFGRDSGGIVALNNVYLDFRNGKPFLSFARLRNLKGEVGSARGVDRNLGGADGRESLTLADRMMCCCPMLYRGKDEYREEASRKSLLSDTRNSKSDMHIPNLIDVDRDSLVIKLLNSSSQRNALNVTTGVTPHF